MKVMQAQGFAFVFGFRRRFAEFQDFAHVAIRRSGMVLAGCPNSAVAATHGITPAAAKVQLSPVEWEAGRAAKRHGRYFIG